MGNNLQMKNNPFRSNAISGKADGQTEVCSAVWLQREGGGGGRENSQGMRAIAGRWGRVLRFLQ